MRRRARPLKPERAPRLDLLTLLGPAPVDVLWEAEKAGWRAFVMGHGGSGYRRGSARDQAWQRGFDAAAASRDPASLML
ncbi:hypothetical protein EWH08_19815 [Sphingobium indicum]|jgi:hypothetical protein|uniref:Uncharacterized protein n=1 Tax=Sphingobium indicum TaxID=332055 RepID=A0A4V1W8J1_9SPHN|nr:MULTISPECIES: hypothetical protein [Sphingomonadaceae]NYI25039.1 hypothetical protein [Sphingobium indicum]RYL96246.1 hypothetical protein EWH08_19815 [Sphingobium indicum]